MIGELCQEDKLGAIARVFQSFRFPYVVKFLQTSDQHFVSSLGHSLTARGSDIGVFEWPKYWFRSPMRRWRLTTWVIGNIIYQIMDVVYLITTYVHDDIE